MKSIKKAKSILATLLAVTMCIAMAGCENGNSGNGDKSAETKATTNVTEKADKAEETEAVETSEIAEAPKLPEPVESDIIVPDEMRESVKERDTFALVPNTPVNLSDDINLTEVVVGEDEIAIDIRNCTVQDFKDAQSKNDRIYCESQDKYVNLTQELFFFYGYRFTAGRNCGGFNLELVEDGKLLSYPDYDYQKDSEYEIKALSAAVLPQMTTGYAKFYKGIQLEYNKSRIDQLIGEGYVVEVPESKKTYAYYKNSAATMVIQYNSKMTAQRITVIIND